MQASILVAKYSLLCNSDTPWCCYGPSPELEWNKAAFCCYVLERLSDWYLYCKTFDNVVMEMSAYFSSDSGPMNTWLPQQLSWIFCWLESQAGISWNNLFAIRITFTNEDVMSHRFEHTRSNWLPIKCTLTALPVHHSSFLLTFSLLSLTFFSMTFLSP